MNLEENSLAVTTGSAADVLGPLQSGVRSYILQDLRTLRSSVQHLVAIDAVVVSDLLNQATKQARISEFTCFLPHVLTHFRWVEFFL